MTNIQFEIELQKVMGRVSVLESRLENLEKTMDKRLSAIESNTTWTVRLVLGSLLTAVVGLVWGGTPFG